MHFFIRNKETIFSVIQKLRYINIKYTGNKAVRRKVKNYILKALHVFITEVRRSVYRAARKRDVENPPAILLRGICTYYRAIGVRSPTGTKDFSSNLCVQTGSGAHPASCTMGTGGPFSGAKRGRGVTLTTHPHLVPRSRMSGSYTSYPPKPHHGVSRDCFAFCSVPTAHVQKIVQTVHMGLYGQVFNVRVP
jgi:hypothetical protein